MRDINILNLRLALQENAWLRFVMVTTWQIALFSTLVVIFAVVVDKIYASYQLSGPWIAAEAWIIGVPSFLYVFVVTRKKLVRCLDRKPGEKAPGRFSRRDLLISVLSIGAVVCGAIAVAWLLYGFVPTDGLARLMLVIGPTAWLLFGIAGFCSQVLMRRP